jgi:hypothetical protein
VHSAAHAQQRQAFKNLASDASAYVTGQAFCIDSGASIG